MRSLAPARRGILGGAVLLAIGGGFLLQAAGRGDAGYYLFLFLGLAFGAAWRLGSRQYVYLVPAAVLIGFAVGLLVPLWLGLADDTKFSIFLGTLALALVLAFVIDRTRRMPLLFAALLAIVAIGDVVAPDVIANQPGLVPYLVPVVLIAVGLYLLAERQSR